MADVVDAAEQEREALNTGTKAVAESHKFDEAALEAWMKANAPDAEQVVMTTQRFFRGHPGPAIDWKIYVQPPAK